MHQRNANALVLGRRAILALEVHPVFTESMVQLALKETKAIKVRSAISEIKVA
jgi:hypothetical protein